MKEQLSKIGFISKLHGFKGEVVLILEEIDFVELEKAKFLFIKLDGLPVPFAVEELKERNGNAIIKFEDVNDPDYAKRFLKNDVLMELKGRKKKITKAAGINILGYEIIDSGYGSLGKIEKIEEYPQQMIATCIINGKDVLIPLNENFIESINDSEQKIFINLPEGLIDIYLNP